MDTATVNEFIKLLNENPQLEIKVVTVEVGNKEYSYQNFDKLSKDFGDRQCCIRCRPMFIGGLKTAKLKIV